MKIAITVLLFLTGWLLGRAVALLLAATPTTLFRRSAMLLITLACVCPTLALSYFDELPPQFVAFAACLAAAIGFILSQRSDRTVRVWGTLAVAPLTIATTFTIVVLSTGELLSYPATSNAPQIALAVAFPMGWMLATFWCVPILLWRSRTSESHLPSPRRAIVHAMVVGLTVAIVVGIYDRGLRARITQRARETSAERTKLFHLDLPMPSNAAIEYEKFATKLRQNPQFETLLYRKTWGVGMTRQHRSLLDSLKQVTENESPFRFNEVASCDWLESIHTLACGLVSRATQSETSAEMAVSDLVAVRRLQRHLSQDPRTPAVYLESLEARMKPALERIPSPRRQESLLSRLPEPFAEPTLEAPEIIDNAFYAQLLQRRYLPAATEPIARRIFLFVNRILWLENEINSDFDPTALDFADGTYPSWAFSDRTELNRIVQINDAGILVGGFFDENYRLPTREELPELFAEHKDLVEKVEILRTPKGGLVLHARDKEDVQTLLAESNGGRLRDTLNEIATRCFLIGDATRYYDRGIRGNTSAFLLIAPSHRQTFELLAAARDDRYADVYDQTLQSIPEEEKAVFLDAHGGLVQVLNSEYEIESGDRWFDHDASFQAWHGSSGNTHLLSFWSDKEVTERRKQLAKVRRDDFDFAIGMALGIDMNEEFQKSAWKELSLLADYLEWSADKRRPVICIKIRRP